MVKALLAGGIFAVGLLLIFWTEHAAQAAECVTLPEAAAAAQLNGGSVLGAMQLEGGRVDRLLVARFPDGVKVMAFAQGCAVGPGVPVEPPPARPMAPRAAPADGAA